MYIFYDTSLRIEMLCAHRNESPVIEHRDVRACVNISKTPQVTFQEPDPTSQKTVCGHFEP
jgi:hypothetical protein